MELAGFLIDRIAEDEEKARAYLPYAAARRLDGWFLRFLAECEVKRQIVQYFAVGMSEENGHARTTLCLLSQPYASHPDYHPEWRL